MLIYMPKRAFVQDSDPLLLKRYFHIPSSLHVCVRRFMFCLFVHKLHRSVSTWTLNLKNLLIIHWYRFSLCWESHKLSRDISPWQWKSTNGTTENHCSNRKWCHTNPFPRREIRLNGYGYYAFWICYYWPYDEIENLIFYLTCFLK